MRPVPTVSLRTRLTLWYSLAMVLVLSLFAADLALVQGRLGIRRIDRELTGVTATLTTVIREELEERKDLMSAAEEACRTVAGLGQAVAIIDDRGVPVSATWNGLDLHGHYPAAADDPRSWTVQMSSGAWRVHAQPEILGATRLVLLVASPLTDVRREQHEVQEALTVAIPIALLLAGGGGLWLAWIGLRPITEMAGRAARIPLTGLEDLGHTGRTDELGQLARAFNGLVARLRAALQTQQQFMADASHELRTPVSVVRTASDVALSRSHRDEADYRETLGIVRDQSRRLSRLVEDMLVLARADAGGYRLRPVDLYLDEIIAECRRAVDVLAAGRGVTVAAGEIPELPFRGDEDLLRQLVSNLLQNAVQHTPAGGTASIAVCKDTGTVTIRVTDTGEGIGSADQARIFDRFVQLDPSRRATGTGLGLPIARWIAQAHGGTLLLETSGPQGSTFSVSLPVVDRVDY
jgi:signal transduction histidine kinase